MTLSIFNAINSHNQTRMTGFAILLCFILISFGGLYYKGLNMGLEFTGGYLTQFETSQSISKQEMQNTLNKVIQSEFKLSETSNGTIWSVRQAQLSEANQGDWLKQLGNSSFTVKTLDTVYIGSQVGDELINQGGLAMLTALLAILLYLSTRFEWRLAIGAVSALFNDIIIVLGVFAWFELEFDLTVLASLLAIIGYSLNDSIIVADRVRALLTVNTRHQVGFIINQAIISTLTRTLITSGTTLATIIAIWLLAGPPLASFATALFCGVLVGTLSSICISATLPEILGLTTAHYQTTIDEEAALLP